MEHGTKVHEDIANRKGGYEEVDYALTIIEQIQTKPKIEYIEYKFALDEHCKIVSFKSKQALFRGIIDYAVCFLSEEKPEIKQVDIIDWKTGKYRNSKKQLNHYTLFMFLLHESIKSVRCRNIFVTARRLSPVWKIARKYKDVIWQKIKDNIEEIREEQLWGPTITPLCGWCDFADQCESDLSYRNWFKDYAERRIS